MFSPSTSCVRSGAFLSNEGLVWTAEQDKLLFRIRNLSSHYLVIGCNNFHVLLKKIKKADEIFIVGESVLLPPAGELRHSPWLQSCCPAPAGLWSCQDKHSVPETEAASSFLISLKCQVKLWSSRVVKAEKGSAVLSWTEFPLREFVLQVNSQEPQGHAGAPTPSWALSGHSARGRQCH